MWLVSRPCWFSDVGMFDFSVFPSRVFHSIILRSEEEPWRTQFPLLVFAAVKKMAPSSREAIGPEVLDACTPFGVVGVDLQSLS